MRGRPLIGVTRLRGLLSYHEGQSLQRAMLDRRKAGAAPDTLLLLEHQPVFTLGRLQESASNLLASSEELAAAGASVYQSDRGGNITFHGPGQLVAYPILDLRGHTASARWYISALEEAMIGTAARFGVSARAGGEGQTGVWVDDRKLGAIGVRVARFFTSHGMALNADTNLDFFKMMVPCGLHDAPRVTSLTQELGRQCDVDEAAAAFKDAFAESLSVELYESDVGEKVLHEVRVAAALAEAKSRSSSSGSSQQ